MNLLIKIIKRPIVRKLSYVNTKYYMSNYVKILHDLGVNIPAYDGRSYIDPTADIDGVDYSKITIGQNVTISKKVTLLTHDYTIRNALSTINKNPKDLRYRFLKEIKIGNNSFIGANAIILGGTVIEEDVIIGAGAVIKGRVPKNTIWAGNPAKQLCTTEAFAKRHYELNDYSI